MDYRVTIDNEPDNWRERELIEKGLNKYHIRRIDNPEEEPYVCFSTSRRNAVRQYNRNKKRL